MRPHGWPSFWTILAAIAGVVGAGAAVYPLLQTDQHAAHLTFPHYLNSQPYRVWRVWVVALSDPIILTGRWYISRGPWWRLQTMRDGTAVGAYDSRVSKGALPLKDIRVAANERGYVLIRYEEIEEWVGGSITACKTGEFEIGIEYKWKGGTSWARTALPLCVSTT